MLTESLRELEYDGLVRRHSYETVLLAVTYHLTDLGKSPSPYHGRALRLGQCLGSATQCSITLTSNREEPQRR
ncbi:winged helix-turn-helix transcriptional regulator [Levilactobacillus yonginensis]|uniref:winged helix-turn-helix transcriptional regulator n=1 Tax=Levilactobacillus yonginensis TaxID=1054041 RepID=UPI00345DB237